METSCPSAPERRQVRQRRYLPYPGMQLGQSVCMLVRLLFYGVINISPNDSKAMLPAKQRKHQVDSYYCDTSTHFYLTVENALPLVAHRHIRRPPRCSLAVPVLRTWSLCLHAANHTQWELFTVQLSVSACQANSISSQSPHLLAAGVN